MDSICSGILIVVRFEHSVKVYGYMVVSAPNSISVKQEHLAKAPSPITKGILVKFIDSKAEQSQKASFSMAVRFTSCIVASTPSGISGIGRVAVLNVEQPLNAPSQIVVSSL